MLATTALKRCTHIHIHTNNNSRKDSAHRGVDTLLQICEYCINIITDRNMRPTLCHGFESKITSQEGPLTTRLLGEFHGSLAGSHSNRVGHDRVPFFFSGRIHKS